MYEEMLSSYQRWESEYKKSPDPDIYCLAPNGEFDPELSWLLRSVDGLRPIMVRLFPQLNVDYLIWDLPTCNACVDPPVDGRSRVYVASGCGRHFLSWAEGLHLKLLPFIENEFERGLLTMWAVPRESGPLPAQSMGADAYSVAALGSILAHELGHVHEGQYTRNYGMLRDKEPRKALINHGEEFAADWWSVWVAADLLRPFVDLALQVPTTLQIRPACGKLLSTLALSAFACVDQLSFKPSWTPINANDKDDSHPVELARLLVASVALSDWWIYRRGETADAAFEMVITALQRILAASASDGPGQEHLLALLMQRYETAKSYLEEVRSIYRKV